MRLRQAVDAACASADVGSSALLVERPVGRPLAVSVVPLRMDHGGRYALLIIDPGSTVEGAVPKLQSLYGLTPAEAEIGRRIAEGLRPQWIADDRRVSVDTVRSPIKPLLATPGCTRPSELVPRIQPPPDP